MSQLPRGQLLEEYVRGAGEPGRWADGLTPAELDAHPQPGKWSVREVIVHVLDSDLIATHRMRRIVAEDLPLLIAYDETRFADRLDYSGENVTLACELFSLNRRWTGAWLGRMELGVWSRPGVHNQSGRVSLEDLVWGYIRHLSHHATFVAEKRRLLGKPLLGV